MVNLQLRGVVTDVYHYDAGNFKGRAYDGGNIVTVKTLDNAGKADGEVKLTFPESVDISKLPQLTPISITAAVLCKSKGGDESGKGGGYKFVVSQFSVSK